MGGLLAACAAARVATCRVPRRRRAFVPHRAKALRPVECRDVGGPALRRLETAWFHKCYLTGILHHHAGAARKGQRANAAAEADEDVGKHENRDAAPGDAPSEAGRKRKARRLVQANDWSELAPLLGEITVDGRPVALRRPGESICANHFVPKR